MVIKKTKKNSLWIYISIRNISSNGEQKRWQYCIHGEYKLRNTAKTARLQYTAICSLIKVTTVLKNVFTQKMTRRWSLNKWKEKEGLKN